MHNDIYKHIEPIDFKILQAVLSQKEQMGEETNEIERFQMLGFGSMR